MVDRTQEAERTRARAPDEPKPTTRAPEPRRMGVRLTGVPRQASPAECYLLAAILHPMGVEGLSADEHDLTESEVRAIADRTPGCPPGTLTATPA